MVNGNSYKGKHLIGGSLQFQRFSHRLPSWREAWQQAGMVLEKELRILHLDLKSANRRVFSEGSEKDAVFHTALGGA